MHHDMLPPGFDKLNLTDDQKAKIKEIFKQTRDEMKQKIDAVLTDDQKAQLEKMKADHKGGPGGHGGGGTPPTPPVGQ
jgi:Spy/CpxP family protein refolding chaperone